MHLQASTSLTDTVGVQNYVLQLEQLSHSHTVLASLSTGGFKFVHLAQGGLVHGQSTQFTERVTDMHSSACLGDPHLFQTSSIDGFVRTWDSRSGSAPVESYSSQRGSPIFSCDSDPTRVIGGVGDELYLWDRRTRKTIGKFADTHLMDIVQVRWNRVSANCFVSASEDGNVAVFDLTEVIDEEDSFVGAISINSASRIGFFGPDSERLWCTSNMESLHWWDWRASCDPECSSGAGVTAEAQTAREDMSMDYIIRCHQDPSSGTMYCLSGDVEGSVAVYPCHDTQGRIHFGASPLIVLKGGHSGVVRDTITLSDSNSLLSGGEDGKICVWGGNDDTCAAEAHDRRRYSPY
jgi:WD40 repeat protein